jgi:hypothetical protein
MRLLAGLLILLAIGTWGPRALYTFATRIWAWTICPALVLAALSAFVERGRAVAVTASILVAAIACIFPLEITGRCAMGLSQPHPPLAILFPMGFALLTALGLALLIVELIRARRAVGNALDAPRGFEPVMNRPSAAIAPSTLPGDSHDPHSQR